MKIHPALFLLMLALLACSTKNDKDYLKVVDQVMKERGYERTSNREITEIKYDTTVVNKIHQLNFLKKDVSITVLLTQYTSEEAGMSDASSETQIELNKMIAKENDYYRGLGGNLDFNLKIFSSTTEANHEVDTLYAEMKKRFPFN